MKICLNCGDKLLDTAKKCPSCGTKDNSFPIIDSSKKEMIQEIIASVPNPKSGTPKWQEHMENKNMTFKEILKNTPNSQNRKNLLSEKGKLAQLEKDAIPYCPKCHSTSLSANKKGFGIGKAVIGAAATGGIGLIAGNINAKKVRLTCMNCGHQFWPGN
ncbi:MAG: zinc-ribbon domain-containing protein [Anaerovoracaceae bacterium]